MWGVAPASASPRGFPTVAHPLFWLTYWLRWVKPAPHCYRCAVKVHVDAAYPLENVALAVVGRLHLENMLETHPGFILENIWLIRLKVPVVGQIVSC